MNNEIQNLIDEKKMLNNTIKLRRDRHNEEIEKLKQEYFLYRNDGDKYRSSSLLNHEIEEANKKFEESLKQEFEPKLQESNNSLKAEKQRLTDLLASKSNEYNSIIREFRQGYMQGPLQMANLEKLKDEIDEIQRDIKTIEESIGMDEISIQEVQPQQGQSQEVPKPERQGQSEPEKSEQGPERQGQSEPEKSEQNPERQSQPQQGQNRPNMQESSQGESIIPSKNPSRFDNIKNGVNAITAKVPVGKRMKENKDNKLKVKIGGVISTELDGENKTVGMSYYAENKDDDTRIYKLFKKLGFDDKAIDSTWKEINSARGDINVVKALLESSKDGMQAVKYLDDYLDVIKGNKKKLETFTLEYNLRDKSKFGKGEWKNFKDMALSSRTFAKVKGKNIYLLAMKLANLKPIKAISWPFKKAVKAIQGRKVEKITDGSGNSMREKLEGKLELGKVKVNEKAARQVAEEKAKDPQSKEKRER